LILPICNTGISSKINNSMSAKNHWIIIVNKDAISGPHIGSKMLCMVDMRNGEMVVVVVGLER
jgi:hypothetical protein